MFLINLLGAARDALSDWRRRQQAYAELSALDDHSLADIGIHRSEIPGIVEGFRQASLPARESEYPAAFASRRLAGGHTWFSWLPPL